VKSVFAFLQARMGSTRLPGKGLLRIAGRTLIARAVERLRAATMLNEVVVLTTHLLDDDAIAEEARHLGAPVFRGPELDVLGRFQEAAERYKPDIIVRATGDNPLIDIGSVDRITRALRSSRLDYCMECDLPVGAATEAMTREALLRTAKRGKTPHHREHVTTYIKEHPEEFRIAFLSPPDILRRPEIRVTVDTPQDFIYLESLISCLPDEGKPHPLEKYLCLGVIRTGERS